jgi:hypothetical protein
MILMLIFAAWFVALATVTALCAMARRGDAAQHSQQHDPDRAATCTPIAAHALSSSEARRIDTASRAPGRSLSWLDRRHARLHVSAAARRPQAGWRRRTG